MSEALQITLGYILVATVVAAALAARATRCERGVGSAGGKPRERVVIVDCGELGEGEGIVAEAAPAILGAKIERATRVDKTLLMDYVDLRTGNVDFDGSVLVKQDVSAGVTVKATGDITSPFGDVLAKSGETRDGGSFYDRMGAVACWNAVMDENQYMVRKWNEFIAA